MDRACNTLGGHEMIMNSGFISQLPTEVEEQDRIGDGNKFRQGHCTVLPLLAAPMAMPRSHRSASDMLVCSACARRGKSRCDFGGWNPDIS